VNAGSLSHLDSDWRESCIPPVTAHSRNSGRAVHSGPHVNLYNQFAAYHGWCTCLRGGRRCDDISLMLVSVQHPEIAWKNVFVVYKRSTDGHPTTIHRNELMGLFGGRGHLKEMNDSASLKPFLALTGTSIQNTVECSMVELGTPRKKPF